MKTKRNRKTRFGALLLSLYLLIGLMPTTVFAANRDLNMKETVSVDSEIGNGDNGYAKSISANASEDVCDLQEIVSETTEESCAEYIKRNLLTETSADEEYQVYANSTEPIILPVRTLEAGEADYSLAAELTANFTPDVAVSVGVFNEYQGLSIDYRYPMEQIEWYGPVSEGYNIQVEYTVTIPVSSYDGAGLSGMLTVPLPYGYDAASARIKDGAAASSYTANSVSFPVTLVYEGYDALSLSVLIEYKEIQAPVQLPVIIAGADGLWQQGGANGLSFTSNAEFDDFIKVQVDDADLDISNYTVQKGSTIVILNADYLKTLSVGQHSLAIVSKTGTATAEFTITAAQSSGEDQSSSENQSGSDDQTGGNTEQQASDGNSVTTSIPKTGDERNIILWISLLFASGAGITITVLLNKKSHCTK